MNKVLWILVVVGVAAAFATGLLNWTQVKTKAQNAAIGAESLAKSKLQVSAPTAQDIAAAKDCVQNLRRIESAKRAISSRQGGSIGDVSIDAVIKEMGGRAPMCPKGGTYKFGALSQLPRCSMESCGTVETNDDHILKVF